MLFTISIWIVLGLITYLICTIYGRHIAKKVKKNRAPQWGWS